MKQILHFAIIALLYMLIPQHSEAAIYRFSLTEHKPILTLSQQFAIEILDYPEGRQDIFVEFLEGTEGEYNLTFLPRHAKVRYRLLYRRDPGRPLHIFQLGRGAEASMVSLERIEEKTLSYILDENSFRFTLREAAEYSVKATVQQSTVTAPDNAFSLIFDKGSLNQPLTVRIGTIAMGILPQGLTEVSSIYRFEIDGEGIHDPAFPISLKISYTVDTPDSKSLYYYATSSAQWVLLPSYNNVEGKFITAKIPFAGASVAIFARPAAQDGIASWYAYKKCLCAASRHYPKGSKVKVTRLKTQQSVIVTINDYGPEAWTGRAIDLDATAFKKIGSLGAGLIYVSVEPYQER